LCGADVNTRVLWTSATWRRKTATLGLVTIASHCLSLLHERGPLTAEELGSACRDAGVTTAQQPAQAAASALTWNVDGRALLVRGRYHAVTNLPFVRTRGDDLGAS
jgi:hypothetical protein